VLTPIGLVARMLGKDFLNRHLDRGRGSYWAIRAKSDRDPKQRLEQQF